MKKDIRRVTALIITLMAGFYCAIGPSNFRITPRPSEVVIVEAIPEVTTLEHHFISNRWRTEGAEALVTIKVYDTRANMVIAAGKLCDLWDIRVEGLTTTKDGKFFIVLLHRDDPTFEETVFHELTHVAQLIAMKNKLPLMQDLEPTAYINGQLVAEILPKIMEAL